MTSDLATLPPSVRVTDLVRSIPTLLSSETVGAQRWRRFEVTAWPQAWKASALALGMFETSDFHSLANVWHDADVRAGKASGPYQGNSRFKGWWSAPNLDPTSSNDDEDPHGLKPVHDAFDAWLVTDPSDQYVLGLMVFERWVNKVREVPEIPMDARCKPRFTIPTRVIGQACFWVHPSHRGQGLGTRMAERLVNAYQPLLSAQYHVDRAMPFMVASDRALTLFERVAPWPLIGQRNHNVGQRRDILHHAIYRSDDWPAWSVPLHDIAQSPAQAKPGRRRRPG